MATKKRTWLQIHVVVPKADADHIEKVFETFAALAITYADAGNQPMFEPAIDQSPLWSLSQITGLFPVPTDIDKWALGVKQAINLTYPFEFFHNQLEDQDWQRAWLNYFKPMQFGDNLWIIPDTYEPPVTDTVNIHLDPGLAFGTGTHETTSLCLTWLDQHHPKDLNVIDYGCGSGILAIAAAKLGAKQVHAIDIDPQAITTCDNNAEKNNVDHLIHTSLVANWQPQPAQLLIANILSGPLIKLAPHFAELCVAGSHLILSGLLASQVDQIKSAYKLSFGQFETQLKGDWALLKCRRLV